MRIILAATLLSGLAYATSFNITTPLYNNTTGSGSCSPSGLLTRCDYNTVWSNGTSNYGGSAEAQTGNGVTTVTITSYQSRTDNWGVATTSSLLSENSGASWGTQDYYNRTDSSWTGNSASSDGQTIRWGGWDVQTNHTIYQFLSFWSCLAGTCRQDTWWTQNNEYDYVGQGWWYSTMFSELVASGEWTNTPRTIFSSDAGYSSVTWNADGTPRSSEVPEPSTWVMIGLALIGTCKLNPRRREIA